MVLLGFALFIIVLLIIGMPVAFTLSLAGILGIIQFVDMSTLSQVPVIAFKTLNSYVLTSVPLYILMSQIMLTGRVGSGLFDLGSKWMGHLPGGLGIATIFENTMLGNWFKRHYIGLLIVGYICVIT